MINQTVMMMVAVMVMVVMLVVKVMGKIDSTIFLKMMSLYFFRHLLDYFAPSCWFLFVVVVVVVFSLVVHHWTALVLVFLRAKVARRNLTVVASFWLLEG